MVVGDYPKCMLMYAHQIHPDLIVMGINGANNPLAMRLKGIVVRAIRISDCPILAVRAPYTGLKRVLLVTDGSQNSSYAAQYLAKFPLKANTQVDVVCVLPSKSAQRTMPAIWGYSNGWFESVHLLDVSQVDDQTGDISEADGQEFIDEAIETLHGERLSARGVLVKGDPAEEILAYARAHAVNLIVIGGCGRHATNSKPLGNVVGKLINAAMCSILVIKGKPRLISLK